MFTKIKYRNNCDLQGSVFQDETFYYVLYLDVDVGKPTYEVIDEGREDGEKNFISDFRKITKRYEFTTVVPEYQFDALCQIMIHDTIFVKLKNDEEDRVFNFLVTPAGWDTNGAMLTVTVSYTTQYTIATNCCNNEKLIQTPCYSCYTGLFKPTDVTWQDKSVATSWQDRAWVMLGETNPITGELERNILYQFRNSKKNNALAGLTNFLDMPYVHNPYKMVCFTHGGVPYEFYLANGFWFPAGVIRSFSIDGTVGTIRAWGYPLSFAQVYVSSDGVTYNTYGSPVYYSVIQNSGVKVTITGVTHIKVLFYTTKCDYGFTNVQAVIP